MSQKEIASVLTNADVLAAPHYWVVLAAAGVPTLAVCVTVAVLVMSTDRSQRASVIKALAPVLIALASRQTRLRGGRARRR